MSKFALRDLSQQPPEDGDVDADRVEGEAEHDRPDEAAYRAKLVVASHVGRLGLIPTRSVPAVAKALFAEVAIGLNLAGRTVVRGLGRKILVALAALLNDQTRAIAVAAYLLFAVLGFNLGVAAVGLLRAMTQPED